MIVNNDIKTIARPPSPERNINFKTVCMELNYVGSGRMESVENMYIIQF